MERKKFTVMQELIFEGILRKVPDMNNLESTEVGSGDILGYISSEMTKRKDTGVKGGVAGTKGWADMFRLATKDLVQMGYLKEKKGLISSKLTLTKAGLEAYKEYKKQP
ncbi:MAG TPA: hypothetical protein P5168_00430 [Candidatus Methanomethylicus sp.]|nr:hypothetical protein [Candidatus Methanomethylicus sp.]HRR53819.1 hypothetical protein [Candidatus Methanomethylicus sp.]HRU80994.1 hypothetical protein [Candidatus Methanomethylicus sp.]